MMTWILRISESKVNYWATYAVDLGLMTFFLAWDVVSLHEGVASVAAFYALGLFAWSLTEYVFHRWVYHLEFGWLFSHGHDRHHEDPTSYTAMPWFVTPVLFLPLQLTVAGWLGVHGFSSFVAGWFGGFVAYSFMHHSLHHYKLPFAWYRHLQSQHRIHHALPETNFGVTMRFWDRVFGTEFIKHP
jgi:4-hydroxysphinganine ceramide fatty acyl 2-hydroxylase